MCHTLASEYGWSKNQIDEVYAQEAIILLRFIAFDKRDKELTEKIDYYKNLTQLVSIQHGDPNEFRQQCIQNIEAIQKLKVNTLSAPVDDDMPDFTRINQLKQTLKQQAENMK
jgi:hypothetical protein